MSKKRSKTKRLSKKLFNKNRLVILNEDTFEEIFSLKLNLMNVFVLLTVSSIFLIAITAYIIAFTPLREYIPGYASSKLKKEATYLAIKSDSVDYALKQNNAYIESIRKVLTGEVEYTKFNKDSIIAAELSDVSHINFAPSKEDSLLRNKVRLEDKYNLFEKAQRKVCVVLFPPVKGYITKKYDVKTKHLFIDISLSPNVSIKSIANGTVIFSEWTPTSGNTIIVEHSERIISVYKNCNSVTKEQGDKVNAGEVLAIGGTKEEQSTVVNFHFELWKDGNPVDPTNFIDFE